MTKLHIAIIAVTGSFLASFVIYASRGLELWVGAVCAGYLLLFLLSVCQWLALAEKLQQIYINPDYMDTRRALPIILMSLGFVLSLYTALALGIHSRYPHLGILQAFAVDLMNDIDVRNYQQLAEYWYSPELSVITLLPFYPALVRAFSITGGFFPTAVAIGALCAVGSGVYIYRLALLDYDHKTALRAVKYMYIFPSAFFFAVPLAGNTSLFFAILFMYMIRKRYHWGAALAGFCAAMCDVFGALMIIPALAELANEYRVSSKRANGLWVAESRARALLRAMLPLAGVACGFGAYLKINYDCYGDAFYFMGRRYQYFERVSWLFWDTAAYLLTQTKVWLSSAPELAYAISIPNLVCMLIVLLLLAVSARKIRPSYLAYGVCYFFLYFGLLGDLNGPRHTIGLFPLAIAAAALTKSRLADICLTLAYAAGFAVYFHVSVCS